MRKISDIYSAYKILPALGEHMLRVAAVASMICDNFDEKLPKKDIVTACLLHDMGNIIKSDLKLLPTLIEASDFEYWDNIKRGYLKKYGNDEHDATIMIAREIGVNTRVIAYINDIDFYKNLKLLNKSSETQINSYADCRVTPFGIVPVLDRLSEARERYKNRPDRFTEEKWDEYIEVILKTETQIFSKCNIKPEDINDESAKPVIEALRDFMV